MKRLLILSLFILNCNLYSQNLDSFKIIKRTGTYGKFFIYQFDGEGKIEKITDGFRMTKKHNDTMVNLEISFIYKNGSLAEVIYKSKERIDMTSYQQGIDQKYRDVKKYVFDYYPNKKIKSYTQTLKRFYPNLKKDNVSTSTYLTQMKYDDNWNLSLMRGEYYDYLFSYDNSNRITEIKKKSTPTELTEGMAEVTIDPEKYLLKELYFYANDTIKTENYEYISPTETSALNYKLESIHGKNNRLLEKKYTYNPENASIELFEGNRFSYSENGIINEIFYSNSDPIKLILESKTNINLPDNVIKNINEIILNNGNSIFGHPFEIISAF